MPRNNSSGLDQLLSSYATARSDSIRKNTGRENEGIYKDDFGRVSTNPYFVATEPGQVTNFLNRTLSTSAGGAVTFKRVSSCDAGTYAGYSDKYEAYTHDGVIYGVIFVNDYCSRTSSKPPVGFTTKTSSSAPIPKAVESVCRRCGKILPSDASFCPYCGNTKQVQEPPQTPKIQFCKKCGTKLLDECMFCHKCGTPVTTLSQMPAPTPPRTNPVPQMSTPLINIDAFTKYSEPNRLEEEKQKKAKQKRKKKRIKRLLIILVILAVLFCLIWPNKEKLAAEFLYDVEIKGSEEYHLYVNDTLRLSAKIETVFGQQPRITWSSSDTSVVTVTSTGNIKARGKGEATITVSVNGVEKDSCTIIIGMKPVTVKNGQIIIKPNRTSYPEVTVHAPSNANCFVYLKNVLQNGNSCAFYVSKGKSATVNVAPGTYEFYYATGDTWYGTEYKFGSGTGFFKDPTPFSLTEDDESYDIMEFTLYSVANGNMQPKTINENDFPV